MRPRSSIIYSAVLAIFIFWGLAALAAPAPKNLVDSTKILVLDDCDEANSGKEKYEDSLTMLNSLGKQQFRIKGFNTCQSIGSNHVVSVDPIRKCIWVIENVGNRVRRFDYTGKETLVIPGIKASALAVNEENGQIWVLSGRVIGRGKTAVFNTQGERIAEYDISGWDIAYDRKSKAFWIAEKNLNKVSAAKGEMLFTTYVAKWCVSSIDVDQQRGAVWVATREYDKGDGSSNRLLKFDREGKEQVSIDLKEKWPRQVSVDPKQGNAWVALSGKSIEQFSPEGKQLAEHPAEAIALQADPSGQFVWVVTPRGTQKMTNAGKVVSVAEHVGECLQAWIGLIE